MLGYAHFVVFTSEKIAKKSQSRNQGTETFNVSLSKLVYMVHGKSTEIPFLALVEHLNKKGFTLRRSIAVLTLISQSLSRADS